MCVCVRERGWITHAVAVHPRCSVRDEAAISHPQPPYQNTFQAVDAVAWPFWNVVTPRCGTAELASAASLFSVFRVGQTGPPTRTPTRGHSAGSQSWKALQRASVGDQLSIYNCWNHLLCTTTNPHPKFHRRRHTWYTSKVMWSYLEPVLKTECSTYRSDHWLTRQINGARLGTQGDRMCTECCFAFTRCTGRIKIPCCWRQNNPDCVFTMKSNV